MSLTLTQLRGLLQPNSQQQNLDSMKRELAQLKQQRSELLKNAPSGQDSQTTAAQTIEDATADGNAAAEDALQPLSILTYDSSGTLSGPLSILDPSAGRRRGTL